MAVNDYMSDKGSLDTLGHRRWILSLRISQVAFGSAGSSWSSASCMQVIGSTAISQPRTWVSFPPNGPVPFELFSEVDVTGWSVQSEGIDLSRAQVTIKNGQTSLPVSTIDLLPGYGSNYGLAFTPQGWSTQPNQSYDVTITCAGGQVLTYTVSPVMC